MKKSYSITILLFLIGLCLIILACDDNGVDNNDHYNYLQEDPIEAISATEAPVKYGDSVLVVFSYPAGCNQLHSLDYVRSNDSLIFTLKRRYYYEGQPCAHGEGVDSLYLKIELDTVGYIHFIYTKPDSTIADYLFLIGDANGHYEYFQPLPIDTVSINGNFIPLGEAIQIDYTYPAGCNHLDSAYYTLRDDTLDFYIYYRFYYEGSPCAHGPGTASESLILNGIEPGEYIFHYKKPGWIDVNYPVTVEGGK